MLAADLDVVVAVLRALVELELVSIGFPKTWARVGAATVSNRPQPLWRRGGVAQSPNTAIAARMASASSTTLPTMNTLKRTMMTLPSDWIRLWTTRIAT